MWIADQWKDYEVLDTSGGEKLERWGDYLLVRPDYQGYHIGAELMNRLMSHYTEYLYVKIMPSDPKTIPFYQKFGFERYDNYSAMERKNFT